MKRNKLLCAAFSLGIIGSVNGAFASAQDVPRDIWKEIASYLNTHQKVKLSEVSKYFQGLVCDELQEKKLNEDFNKLYKDYCNNVPTTHQLVDIAKKVANQNENAIQYLMFYEQVEGDPSEAIIWMDKFISISKDSSEIGALTLDLKRIAKNILIDKNSVGEAFNGRTDLNELKPAALKILEKYAKK